jgi:hypothetical protein
MTGAEVPKRFIVCAPLKMVHELHVPSIYSGVCLSVGCVSVCLSVGCVSVCLPVCVYVQD